MREISKRGRIYCQQKHNEWAELVPHVEIGSIMQLLVLLWTHLLNLCLPPGSPTYLKN
jgi:hypothetical protein